jgi:hypothetical protein
MPADWLTVDDVAKYLDLPGDPSTDDNLELSTAAARAAVERRRSDLRLVDEDVVAPDDVHAGAVMWAGLIYQTRNAPSGFAGYGDETAVYDALGARRAEVMRLVGWRRPVAI